MNNRWLGKYMNRHDMDGCIDEGMDIGECMHTWTYG